MQLVLPDVVIWWWVFDTEIVLNAEITEFEAKIILDTEIAEFNAEVVIVLEFKVIPTHITITKNDTKENNIYLMLLYLLSDSDWVCYHWRNQYVLIQEELTLINLSLFWHHGTVGHANEHNNSHFYNDETAYSPCYTLHC